MKILFQSLVAVSMLACIPALSTAQITPHEAAALMQKGINLGNTLEPPLEGGWNNPVAQEYYFDLYEEAGFNTVRIPVRWDEHTQDAWPYTITETWLQRVEKLVDWALERDLFVVVNAHHDDWIKQNYTNAVYRARFDSIWSQVATRFKDKPEKLLFEILNEPYGLTKAQNDEMHQRVLSIIRKTNPTRIVIFQGHEWGGSEQLIAAAIPDDDYIMGSFHSYDPYLFGLEGQGTWGSTSDYTALKNKFITVKTWSDQNNIPVFLGEFGSLRSCDYNSRMKHYRAYVELAKHYGFAYCAWDDGGDFLIMERATRKWDEVKDILVNTTAWAPRNLNLKIIQDTIIKVYWSNPQADYDSLFVEHRTPTGSYARMASLKGDTTSFLHTNPTREMFHHYRIIAHYNTGTELYSQPIRIFMPVYIPKIRGMFYGVPLAIPGTIEAEDFDTGGENLTYHDNTIANLGGAYRTTESVDIFDRLGNGYQIGSIARGEWCEYTVDVEQGGPYKVDVQVATFEPGGTFTLKTESAESDTFTVPNTQSRIITTTLSDTMDLEPGVQIIRLSIVDDPVFYIDKIIFTFLTPPVSTDLLNQKPFTAYLNQNREMVIESFWPDQFQQIQVIDITGRLVRVIPYPELISKITTRDMPNGLYIIRAVNSEEDYILKMMLD